MVSVKLQFQAFVRHSTSTMASLPTQTVISDDSVRPQTEDEKQLYELLSLVTRSPASVLSSRWREPSLTVHNISVSGPGSKSSD